MLDRQVKLLLRIGATLGALTGLLTLVIPDVTANALGLPLDLDPTITLWNLRISAGILLILSGFMALAAAFFPERALRQSGAVMVLSALLLAILLIFAPIPWRWGRAVAIGVALLFILFYLKALRARMRHR